MRSVRDVLKVVMNVLATIIVAPWILWASLGMRSGTERLYSGATFALAPVPGDLGVYLRRAFYHFVLEEAHWDLAIHYGSVITHPTARIGRRVYIGAYCMIGTCQMGDDVIIAARVSVLSGRRQHGFEKDATVASQPGHFETVKIGNDVWLGEASVVMADVGSKSVVGAGAVVVKPVAIGVVVGGNPAKQIGTRE